MEPASTQLNPSTNNLVLPASNTLSMQLMTATGTGGGSGGSTNATSNKPQSQQQQQPVGINRKVLAADVNNYNLDHLYCHPNDKKTQQPVTPFLRGATAATGGPPPGTDMGAVLKEIKHLKAMLLLHLDLIQEQSDQLMSKDKLVTTLRKENEVLRQRVADFAITNPNTGVPSSTTASTANVPIVVTKSGRCSKPVLIPVAVAKDDAANKIQPTGHPHHQQQHFSVQQHPGTFSALSPKVEPQEANDPPMVLDAKSEIIKKFSNKLLANCSEKLDSLSASIESK